MLSSADFPQRDVEAADLNEALEWGRKAVVACRAPVEVAAKRKPVLND